MRDHLRELDLERALDVRGGVQVDVVDDGTATVTLGRDLLDRLLVIEDRHHHDCATEDDVATAYHGGLETGRRQVLAELETLKASVA